MFLYFVIPVKTGIYWFRLKDRFLLEFTPITIGAGMTAKVLFQRSQVVTWKWSVVNTDYFLLPVACYLLPATCRFPAGT